MQTVEGERAHLKIINGRFRKHQLGCAAGERNAHEDAPAGPGRLAQD